MKKSTVLASDPMQKKIVDSGYLVIKGPWLVGLFRGSETAHFCRDYNR